MSRPRNVRVLTLFCLVLVAAAGVASAEIDAKRVKAANRLCVKAERSMKAGAIDQAKLQFGEALEAQPGFPNAHLGIGHVAMAQSEFDAALEHYLAALDQFAAFGAVVQDAQAKRYRSVRSDITALRDQINNLQQNSTSTRTQQTIYQIENRIAQLEVVQPPDSSAIGTPPAEFHFYIGNAMFQLGKIDEAVASWERCRDANPKFAMVYNNLALAYWKQGRIDEAVAALDRAEELDFPVNPKFRADLERAAAAG